MPEGYQYAGPDVDCTRPKQEAVRQRLRQFVRVRASEIHEDDVIAWGTADEGPYPTLREASAEAAFELQTLLNVLGPWAAMPPASFGRSTRRTRPGWYRFPGPPGLSDE